MDSLQRQLWTSCNLADYPKNITSGKRWIAWTVVAASVASVALAGILVGLYLTGNLQESNILQKRNQSRNDLLGSRASGTQDAKSRALGLPTFGKVRPVIVPTTTQTKIPVSHSTIGTVDTVLAIAVSKNNILDNSQDTIDDLIDSGLEILDDAVDAAEDIVDDLSNNSVDIVEKINDATDHSMRKEIGEIMNIVVENDRFEDLIDDLNEEISDVIDLRDDIIDNIEDDIEDILEALDDIDNSISNSFDDDDIEEISDIFEPTDDILDDLHDEIGDDDDSGGQEDIDELLDEDRDDDDEDGHDDSAHDEDSIRDDGIGNDDDYNDTNSIDIDDDGIDDILDDLYDESGDDNSDGDDDIDELFHEGIDSDDDGSDHDGDNNRDDEIQDDDDYNDETGISTADDGVNDRDQEDDNGGGNDNDDIIEIDEDHFNDDADDNESIIDIITDDIDDHSDSDSDDDHKINDDDYNDDKGKATVDVDDSAGGRDNDNNVKGEDGDEDNDGQESDTNINGSENDDEIDKLIYRSNDINNVKDDNGDDGKLDDSDGSNGIKENDISHQRAVKVENEDNDDDGSYGATKGNDGAGDSIENITDQLGDRADDDGHSFSVEEVGTSVEGDIPIIEESIEDSENVLTDKPEGSSNSVIMKLNTGIVSDDRVELIVRGNDTGNGITGNIDIVEFVNDGDDENQHVDITIDDFYAGGALKSSDDLTVSEETINLASNVLLGVDTNIVGTSGKVFFNIPNDSRTHGRAVQIVDDEELHNTHTDNFRNFEQKGPVAVHIANSVSLSGYPKSNFRKTALHRVSNNDVDDVEASQPRGIAIHISPPGIPSINNHPGDDEDSENSIDSRNILSTSRPDTGRQRLGLVFPISNVFPTLSLGDGANIPSIDTRTIVPIVPAVVLPQETAADVNNFATEFITLAHTPSDLREISDEDISLVVPDSSLSLSERMASFSDDISTAVIHESPVQHGISIPLPNILSGRQNILSLNAAETYNDENMDGQIISTGTRILSKDKPLADVNTDFPIPVQNIPSMSEIVQEEKSIETEVIPTTSISTFRSNQEPDLFVTRPFIEDDKQNRYNSENFNNDDVESLTNKQSDSQLQSTNDENLETDVIEDDNSANPETPNLADRHWSSDEQSDSRMTRMTRGGRTKSVWTRRRGYFA